MRHAGFGIQLIGTLELSSWSWGILRRASWSRNGHDIGSRWTADRLDQDQVAEKIKRQEAQSRHREEDSYDLLHVIMLKRWTFSPSASSPAFVLSPHIGR